MSRDRPPAYLAVADAYAGPAPTPAYDLDAALNRARSPIGRRVADDWEVVERGPALLPTAVEAAAESERPGGSVAASGTDPAPDGLARDLFAVGREVVEVGWSVRYGQSISASDRERLWAAARRLARLVEVGETFRAPGA